MRIRHLDREVSAFPLPPAMAQMGNRQAGAVFHLAADQIFVRDPITPGNNFFGAVSDAISAGLLSFNRTGVASYIDGAGRLAQAGSGLPRLTHDPMTLLSSSSTLSVGRGFRLLTVSAGYTYPAGSIVRISDTADLSRTMLAQVITHVGTLLMVFVYRSSGSGSGSSWHVIESRGYLSEPQRTNLLLRSCEFDNSGSWASSVGTTITPNAAVAPDGTVTADLWVPPAASGTYVLSQSVAVTAGVDYTASIFIKKSGLLTGGVFYWREDAADLLGMTINLSTMSVVTGSGTVRDVGNGWYRLSITGSVAGTTWRPQIRWAGPNADGSGVYVWGAQLEAGLFPTSFIKTEDSAVTRNLDNLYADLAKVPWSDTTHTIIAHAQPSPDSATNAHTLFSTHDGTINERTSILTTGGGAAGLVTQFRHSNLAQTSMTAAAIASAAFKAAAAGQADDFEFVVNGISKGTDVSGSMPSGVTRLQIGASYSVGLHWSAPIGLITTIPERLSRAKMIAMAP